MTIDPETKKYVDKQLNTMSIKVSSFLSALCQTLENKQILEREEFEKILEQAKQAADFAQALGAGNMKEFSKLFTEAVEKQKEEIEKKAFERDWKDLK